MAPISPGFGALMLLVSCHTRVLVEILETNKPEDRELSRHFGVWCTKLTLESPCLTALDKHYRDNSGRQIRFASVDTIIISTTGTFAGHSRSIDSRSSKIHHQYI